MVIHIYAKTQELLSEFTEVINIIKTKDDEILLTSESKRSFRELDNIKSINDDIIYIVSSVASLGLTNSDIASQLSWFINNSVKLIICNVPSTYEYGVHQPMNQAILSTILQSLSVENKTISFKRSNSGRNKLPFPNNWDELYEKWEKDEITSKQFIEMSGLKKATFYNLLTEYKEIQNRNKQYLKQIKTV